MFDVIDYLAATGSRRHAARRGSLSVRTRRDELRELAGNARVSPQSAPARRRAISRPDAAGRGQSVARGRDRLFRQWRRMSDGLSFSRHAAAVHGDSDGRSVSDHRHPAANAADPRHLPMGDLSPQPRRIDAGDGHRRGTRLYVSRVCPRSAGPDQSRDSPPAGAAVGEQSPHDRIDERAALLASRHAGDLLRRRTRHGRQHLSRRSPRRADADAMERRSQRRLFEGQSATVCIRR